MKKLFLPLAALLTLLVLLGCVPLKPYDGVMRPTKKEIDIYEPGRVVTRPYKVIMSFSDKGHIGEEANKHRDFIEESKKLGADAIILKETQSGGSSFGPFGGGSESAFSALAIVYQ